MKLWKSIKRMSFGQAFRLGWVLLKRPLLIWPTWKATQQTMQVSSSLFGSSHHRSGKANAFRHALWNILICKNTVKFTKNEQKSAFWAKKITDLHEKLAKSEKIDTMMDLHNNEVGSRLFLEEIESNQSDLNDILLKKLEKSQKVAKIEEIEKVENELVYISE